MKEVRVESGKRKGIGREKERKRNRIFKLNFSLFEPPPQKGG